MEESNVCAPTTVSPRIENRNDARAGLWEKRRGGGAHLPSKSETAGDMAWGVARPRGTAGVSWACSTIPTESRCAANPRAGTQNRTTGDGDRLFKKSLAAFQGASPAYRRQWQRRINEEIGEAAKAEAAVNRLCQAAGISRAGYYRFRRRHESKPADMTVRNQIQHIALRWPAYGYRRVHAELIRQGWKINHKRVLRLMRSDNLLCVRRRKFLFTTDSRHGLPIYPNLVEGLVVTSIDQLWVADITYIRLQSGVCLSGRPAGCVLAALSGLGIAAKLGSGSGAGSSAHGAAASQAETGAGASLRSRRAIRFPGLCCGTPTTRLPHQHEPHRFPYDNAQAESFIKTLKYEEVYRTEYRSLED